MPLQQLKSFTAAQLAAAREEIERLQNELQNKPDYDAIRDSEALRRSADRTLQKLRMGQQSTAGKAISAFIKELQK